MNTANYDAFIGGFNKDREGVRDALKARGAYDFQRMAETLRKAQNNLNQWMLRDWFGNHLGDHLWEKFMNNSQGNMLHFFNSLTAEYRFFIIIKAMEMWK